MTESIVVPRSEESESAAARADEVCQALRKDPVTRALAPQLEADIQFLRDVADICARAERRLHTYRAALRVEEEALEDAIRCVFHAVGRASDCSCSDLEIELFPCGLGGALNHASVWLLGEAIKLLKRLERSRNSMAPTVRLASRASLALQIAALRRTLSEHASEENWVRFFRAEERYLIVLLDQRVADTLRESLQLRFRSDASMPYMPAPLRRRTA